MPRESPRTLKQRIVSTACFSPGASYERLGFAIEAIGSELLDWSGRRDLNSGPLAPHASALPGCATSRPRNRCSRGGVVREGAHHTEAGGNAKTLGTRGPDGPEFEHQLGEPGGFGRGQLFHAARAAADVPVHLAGLEHGLLAAQVIAEVLLVAGHALAADGVH